jgi:hypothetical protein
MILAWNAFSVPKNAVARGCPPKTDVELKRKFLKSQEKN